MKIIVQDSQSFAVAQFDSVSNLAYNSTTKVVTITYGSGSTATYDLNRYYISIIW